MARFVRANRSQSTLTAGINDSVTSLTVASIGSFPSMVAGDKFPILIDAGLPTEELGLCTAVAGAVMTFTRGTPASAHSLGATVTLVETKDSLEGIPNYVPEAGILRDYPARNGHLTWNFPPRLGTGGQALTAGVMNLARHEAPPTIALSITNVVIGVTNVPVGTSAAFVGLYTEAGALLGTSTDQTTFGGAAGEKEIAIAGGPFAIAAGAAFYTALLVGTAGGTPPQFGRRAWPASGFGNYGLTTNTLVYATYSTGLSALPTPLVLATMSGGISTEFFMGTS